MKISTIAGICLLAGLGACAKAPGSIAPSYVSDVQYRSWPCATIGEEQARVSSALATASTQQEKARTNDTVGVLLIGLPVSSLSGDNIAPEIGRLKGEQDALARAGSIRRCGTPDEVLAPGEKKPVPGRRA